MSDNYEKMIKEIKDMKQKSRDMQADIDNMRGKMASEEEEMKKAAGIFKKEESANPNDRRPNFRKNGKLYLVRCFICEPEHGQENWLPAAATSTCNWCGWHDPESPVVED